MMRANTPFITLLFSMIMFLSEIRQLAKTTIHGTNIYIQVRHRISQAHVRPYMSNINLPIIPEDVYNNKRECLFQIYVR